MIDCNACEDCHGCPARCGCDPDVTTCPSCERERTTAEDAAVAKLARIFSRLDLAAVPARARVTEVVVEADISSDPQRRPEDLEVLYRGPGGERFGLNGAESTVDLYAHPIAREARGIVVLVIPAALDRFLAVVGAGALRVTMEEAAAAVEGESC